MEPGGSAECAAAPRQPLPPDPRRGLRGFADYHAHMFSDLAFGGYLFAGRAFALEPEPAAARDALAPCKHTSITHPLTAIVASSLGDGVHGHDGYPAFSTWPRANTRVHQQMYVDWLYRAYRYGLRLVVVTPTNSQAICELVHSTRSCDDMDVVQAYVAALRELETWTKENEGGWLEVALSSAEAERIIRDNRLAVVIGMEVDTPFGCGTTEGHTCSVAEMLAKLDAYAAMGVREIIPIHLVDDGFGGAAVYDDRISANNKYLRGDYQQIRDCSAEGVNWRLQGLRGAVGPSMAMLIEKGRLYAPAVPPGEGHCNARGLTDLGRDLLHAMMTRGLLIDMEHMSNLSLADTLHLASEADYPVMLSHSWFRDLKLTRAELETHRGRVSEHWNEQRTEMDRDADTLQAVRRLGGVVGIVTNQGYVTAPAWSGVANDCDTSSKSFAQALRYAAKEMNGSGVGFGTDVNGLNGQPAPRFGSDACGGDYAVPAVRRMQGEAQQQTSRVRYDGSQAVDGVPLTLQCTGERRFDFNDMGMAHYGLLPDLIADLENVNVPREDIDMLFRSAEDYVRMWRQAERRSADLKTR